MTASGVAGSRRWLRSKKHTKKQAQNVHSNGSVYLENAGEKTKQIGMRTTLIADKCDKLLLARH